MDHHLPQSLSLSKITLVLIHSGKCLHRGERLGYMRMEIAEFVLTSYPHSARTIDRCLVIHLSNEWHLIFCNPCSHMERFHLGHTQAIPHTSVNYLPSNWLLVIPQVSSRRNLHRPLCRMSWGRRRGWRGCHWTPLGRRCWSGRAPAHRPGPWGCSLQRCWTCTTRGLWQKGAAVRTEKPEWEGGEGRLLEEIVHQHAIWAFCSRLQEICEAQHKLVDKTRTPDSQGCGQIMLPKYVIPWMRKYCVQVSVQETFVPKCG